MCLSLCAIYLYVVFVYVVGISNCLFMLFLYTVSVCNLVLVYFVTVLWRSTFRLSTVCVSVLCAYAVYSGSLSLHLCIPCHRLFSVCSCRVYGVV